DVRDLSLQDRAREVRLRDVVGTCASAAPVRLRERDDLQTRYRREKCTWLLADLLTVEQVTGIVPGDSGVERPRPLAHPKVAEEFGRVLDLRCESRGPGRPRWVVLQEPAVLLHRGAAARRVHDHRVGGGPFERRDVASREIARELTLAGMRVQGAAAGLVERRDHFDAIAGEDPRRRRVRLAED